MTGTDLNTAQRGALLSLMVAGREVPNPELEGTYGVRLRRPQRESLVSLGYVATRTGTRGTIVLELTDRGWHACHEQLTAGPPPRAGTLGATLYTVLGGLAGFLDRSGLRLADVFGDPPVAVEPAPTSVVDVDDRIRAAYRKLATRPRGWVGLADLRRQLDGISDREVDEALRALFRSPHANLVPESNQKALTDEDRRAAVRIGGEDKHLLSIEDA